MSNIDTLSTLMDIEGINISLFDAYMLLSNAVYLDSIVCMCVLGGRACMCPCSFLPNNDCSHHYIKSWHTYIMAIPIIIAYFQYHNIHTYNMS